MKKIILLLSLIAKNDVSFAMTECPGKIVRTFSGNVGTYWSIFKPDAKPESTSALYFQESMSGAKILISEIIVAKTLQKTVIARFTADNLNCQALGTRSDFVGMWSD